MAKLIDADALIAEYDRVHIGAPGGARKLMQDAPTVDAAPVIFGYWTFGTELHREFMKCSVCLKSQTPTGVFAYCPNCGAKMDGGNEDDL